MSTSLICTEMGLAEPTRMPVVRVSARWSFWMSVGSQRVAGGAERLVLLGGHAGVLGIPKNEYDSAWRPLSG
jgi:hypothetical protein